MVDRPQFEHARGAKSCASLRPGPNSCTPIGRSASPVPKGTEIAASPARLVGIVNTSERYIAIGLLVFSPNGEGHRRRRGTEQEVDLIGTRGEGVNHLRANFEGLAVVGVVVTGRERVGPEHDATLHLGAKARVRVASFIAVTSSASTRSP
jgi:hypothetical protein